MRQQIFTRNSQPPLDEAARDLLAAVDYWIKHIVGLRAPDAGQIAMLLKSATALRRELREKARAAV